MAKKLKHFVRLAAFGNQMKNAFKGFLVTVHSLLYSSSLGLAQINSICLRTTVCKGETSFYAPCTWYSIIITTGHIISSLPGHIGAHTRPISGIEAASGPYNQGKTRERNEDFRSKGTVTFCPNGTGHFVTKEQ